MFVYHPIEYTEEGNWTAEILLTGVECMRNAKCESEDDTDNCR
jgi:hypothetical protein